MDVLAFIASPFAASTCPPRLREAMGAEPFADRNPRTPEDTKADMMSVFAGVPDGSTADITSSTTSGRS